MDIISHGIQGGLMVAILSDKWKHWTYWFLVGFFVAQGVAPDVIGAYGNLILHDSWQLYTSAHSGEIFESLKWFPAYFLHVSIDIFCHAKGGGWDTAGWIIEIIFVPITVYFAYLAWRKRNGVTR